MQFVVDQVRIRFACVYFRVGIKAVRTRGTHIVKALLKFNNKNQLRLKINKFLIIS